MCKVPENTLDPDLTQTGKFTEKCIFVSERLLQQTPHLGCCLFLHLVCGVGVGGEGEPGAAVSQLGECSAPPARPGSRRLPWNSWWSGSPLWKQGPGERLWRSEFCRLFQGYQILIFLIVQGGEQDQSLRLLPVNIRG